MQTKDLILIWSKELNGCFSALTGTSKCSKSLMFIEMQIKSTMRYLLIPPETAHIKKKSSDGVQSRQPAHWECKVA